ncbi:Sensor histidine kinase RcsC [compost metagenome]
MEDRQRSIPRKHLAVWVPLVLLLGLGGGVVWQWQSLETRNRQASQQRFQLEAQDIGQRVLSRMRAYEMVLRGISGLMIGSEQVTLQEWDRAVEQLRLQDRYPGIMALGWARHVEQHRLDDFLTRVQADGRMDYRAFPPGPRDEYVLIDYISPFDWRNRRALGYDMLSEPTRRAAIELALGSGDVTLSAQLVLRQETEEDAQGGVLLYLPVFRPGMPLSNVEERRAALFGFVYGAFRIKELMAGILGAQNRLFDIALTDQQAGGSLVPGSNDGQPGAFEQPFRQTMALDLYGRTWRLDVAGTAQYATTAGSQGMTFSLWMGLAAAGLLALLVGGYLYQRERELYASRVTTEQLSEREERFRLLVERLPVATLLCTAEGRIEMANRRAAELLDCTSEALIGERVRRFLPTIDQLGELLDETDTPMLANDYEAHRDSGERIPVTLSLSVLAVSGGANYLLNLIDLRARKGAEERFRLVVEASPNAIVLVDSQGLISMVNQQTEQMFGHSRQELLGQPVEMLLPMDLRHGHMAFRRGYQDNPEPRRMGNNRDLFGQHRDGRLIPLEVGLSPLRSGEETLVQAVIIDISERKAAEQRLRDQAEQLVLANRYKSEFLANMSHELRTPLNSILILSDQLRQNSAGNLTSKQAKHADIVHRAGSDLLQLINSVLDLAKVESGRMQIKLEPLNMQEMLVELDASMRPLAELKGLQLRTQLEPGVPRDIRSDRARLHQILRNLLSNSLKFTERGEVSLTVACEPYGRDDGREQLSFSVRDTGIGIAAEHHEQIFQAFQQIDGSTSRRFGGTGLGLAITRKLVQALDGEVSLQSTPGQGSCFTVHLPVQVLVQGAPEEQGPQRSGVGPTVLVVEDDANFAMVITEEAHAHGFSCVHCRTGVQALDVLQHERFSAVILDILLPDISGWQLFRRLRGQASHRDIPVHIISCVPQPADWNHDGTRYLVKPIDRVALEQVFIDLQQADQVPGPALLLVEDVEVEREFYRGHLQQLGFDVVTSASAADARRAYAERHFCALVIDLDLPDQDGFDLLESLDRLRPLNGARVVINTGVDVTQQALQRLRHYCAVVVHKHGEDLQALSLAVQGFLGGVRDPEHGWAAPADQAGRALGGRRVLLVDDDVRNVYALTALLDDAGLTVSSAKDGVEAIARYQDGAFDVILMDIAMPNMDGYTATRLLKQEHRCTIPIIALTAHAMKGDREKCLDAGADDYLAKPVSRDELLNMLARWLPATDGASDPLANVLP